MMMNYIKINTVFFDLRSNYKIANDSVYYLKGNGRKVKSIFKDKNIISQEGCSSFITYDNYLIADFWDFGIRIFKNNIVIISLNNYYISSEILCNGIIILYNFIDENYYAFNVNNFNILFKCENYKLLDREFGLYVIKEIILADKINYSNGGIKLIWQHNLSHLGKNPLFNDNRDDKFSKFLGVVGERIFILSAANRIVILNLHDGSLVHVFNLNCNELPNMRDAFIHPEDKHIYCLADHFVMINSETLTIERNIKIVEENNDPNVNTILYGIKNSSYQGDFISFTSFTRHRVGFDKWIGLFDYKKEEVVWHYELLPAEGQLSIPAGETPQLAGDKLYILDTDNTLHILEKG